MDSDDHDDDGDMLALSGSALAALTSFLDERSAAQQALADLKAESYDPDDKTPIDKEYSLEKRASESTKKNVAVSLKDFRRIFKEDWQLSQFWYTEDTATRLVEAISRLSKPTSRIAFLCCPTLYVAYKERALSSQKLRLFEHDRRFAVFASKDFVYYDLYEPLSFVSVDREVFNHSQDIVIADPPFHAQASQENLAISIKHLLHPEEGYLILLTGISLSSILEGIYRGLPKLLRRSFVVEHVGLETPYGCWIGQHNHDGDESGFGEVFVEHD